MNTIICYHGSPGTPKDFSPMKSLCPHTTFLTFDRVRESAPRKNGSILLGYSWGCVPCLRDAAREPASVSGIILISPYLFPSRHIGGLKRLVLNAPIVGTALLRKIAQTSIPEMLRKTSSPQDVPSSYQDVAKELMDPGRLRHALLEKEAPGLAISETLRIIATSALPVAVLFGKGDQTSLESEQIQPIRDSIPNLHERCLKNAGHALPWTHPKELAEAIRSSIESFQGRKRP